MMTARRLALLLPDMSGGGAERVALALLRHFIARGHIVDLVLAKRQGVLMSLVPEEVRIIDLEAARLRDTLRPLIRYLRRDRPYALHAMMWPLTVLAVVAKLLARTRTRIIVSDHIALSKQYGGSAATTAAIRWSTRLIYPKADRRILVSADAAEDLTRLSGLKRDQIDVFYNPLELPAAPKRDREAAPWGEGARIVTVGVLKPQKNHALLLAAFARLRSRRAAQLAIVGEGVERPRLEQLARDWGIADDVIFPGYAIDPWPWLLSADVFVLSSDYEGFGNVLVEALHAGLPVVSTDCESGPREILDGGAYGRLTPCGDPDALAAAMEEAMDHPTDIRAGQTRASAISGIGSLERHLTLMLE